MYMYMANRIHEHSIFLNNYFLLPESAGNDTLVSCSNSQLEEVLDRSLVINIYPTADNEDAPTDVGKVCAIN